MAIEVLKQVFWSIKVFVSKLLNICFKNKIICREAYKYLYRIELRLAGILGRLLALTCGATLHTTVAK